MRIGILTNTFPPNLNGVSMAVKNLAESLQAKGVEVYIATPKVQGAQYPDYVYPLPSLPVKEKVSPDLYIPILYIKKATEFFRQKGVDLIHTHDIFMGGAEGIIIARKLGVPCIHTFHTFVESYPYLKVPARKKIIRTHIRLVCNNYSHITAPSIKVYKYLAQIGFHTPVSQLYNVPAMSLKPTKFDTTLAKELGIKKTDFVCITFCRVAFEKSIDIGLIALRPLLKKYPNFKYIIAGQGPETENLQDLAKRLGIDSQVIFTGRYDSQNLAQIASLAKVFLFTSFTENLPTNIFEAMSLGLPVVSVMDESVDYLLKPEINGVKGEVDELTGWMERLYLDPKLLQTWSEAALESGQAMQNMDIAQDYVDLYTRVLKLDKEKQEKYNLEIEDGRLLKRTGNLVKKVFTWVRGR